HFSSGHPAMDQPPFLRIPRPHQPRQRPARRRNRHYRRASQLHPLDRRPPAHPRLSVALGLAPLRRPYRRLASARLSPLPRNSRSLALRLHRRNPLLRTNLVLTPPAPWRTRPLDSLGSDRPLAHPQRGASWQRLTPTFPLVLGHHPHRR